MDIKTYQKEARRTVSPLNTEIENLTHYILGISTEAGELLDILKKNIAYSKPIDYVNMKEEIGDIMWYIINLCDILCWDLEEIMETNINKLKVRYPDKFSNEKAINRNLKDERNVLEK
jgi:NTP pyrophosphatase (non-canonical NTP hydrolase)